MITSIIIHTVSRDESCWKEYKERDIILDSERIAELSDNGTKGFRINLGYPPKLNGKYSYIEVLKMGNDYLELAHKKYNAEDAGKSELVKSGETVSFEDKLFIYDMSAYYSVEVK